MCQHCILNIYSQFSTKSLVVDIKKLLILLEECCNNLYEGTYSISKEQYKNMIQFKIRAKPVSHWDFSRQHENKRGDLFTEDSGRLAISILPICSN